MQRLQSLPIGMILLIRVIYKNAWLVGVLIFSLRCTDQDLHQTFSPKLEYTSTFKVLHLDKFTPFEDNCVKIYEDLDTGSFIISNFQLGSIDFYDRESGRLKRRIEVTREPSLGISRIGGICPIGGDRFLVIAAFLPIKSIVLDTLGNLIDDSPIDLIGETASLVFNVTSSNSTIADMTSKGDYIFTCFQLFDANKDPNSIQDFGFNYKYSPNTDYFRKLPVHYPREYGGKNVPDVMTVPSTTYNRSADLLVVTWPGLDKIQVVNAVTEQSRWVTPSGGGWSPNLDQSGTQSESSDIRSTRLGGYYNIHYDKINNVYYRIFLKPEDFGKDLDENANHLTSEIGIQIMDQEFKVVGYVNLPAKTYDIYRSFTYEGYFYISRSNVYNSDFDEDKLVFEKMLFHFDSFK